jgi:predicted nicotinamide N-methyase
MTTPPESELFAYDFDEETPCGIVIREKNPQASSAGEASFATRGGAPKAFKEKASADYTGWTIWSSSVLLSRWILENKNLLEGKRCLELGSGCGLVGAVLAFHTKAASITLTDYQPDTLANLRHNIDQNRALQDGESGEAKPSLPEIQVLPLDWDDEEKFESFGKFDVILVSDATYRRSYARKLAVVVDALLEEGGLFAYASPVAREGLPVLVSVLQDRLHYQDVKKVPVPMEWRTNPLRKAPIPGSSPAMEGLPIRYITDEEARGLFPELCVDGYSFVTVTAKKQKKDEHGGDAGEKMR